MHCTIEPSRPDMFFLCALLVCLALCCVLSVPRPFPPLSSTELAGCVPHGLAKAWRTPWRTGELDRRPGVAGRGATALAGEEIVHVYMCLIHVLTIEGGRGRRDEDGGCRGDERQGRAKARQAGY